jgi:hypothetical protein
MAHTVLVSIEEALRQLDHGHGDNGLRFLRRRVRPDFRR